MKSVLCNHLKMYFKLSCLNKMFIYSLWIYGLLSHGVELQTTDASIQICWAQGKLLFSSTSCVSQCGLSHFGIQHIIPS